MQMSLETAPTPLRTEETGLPSLFYCLFLYTLLLTRLRSFKLLNRFYGDYVDLGQDFTEQQWYVYGGKTS